MYIFHFVDILIFCDESRHNTNKLCEGLTLFKRVTRMLINEQKSTISFSSLEVDEIQNTTSKLPFQVHDLDEGLKYLRFHLKPTDNKGG